MIKYTKIVSNREALNKLKKISMQLENVEYEYILHLLKGCIKKIPVPIAILRKNTNVDRARKNNGEELFFKVQDLSYIKDQEIIGKYLTEYGRVNKPHQPMFYGSIESSLIQTQRLTAMIEISPLLQNINMDNLDGELYTVSRWSNKVDIFVAEVVFSSEAIRMNPDVKKAFEKQTQFAKEAGIADIEFYTDFLIFISDQFAREKHTHHDYKISTAYAEVVLNHSGNDGVKVNGIKFPSVQTKYMSENVVFPPKVIDDHFEIKVTSTQRVYRKGADVLITNDKFCSNLAKNHENLIWTEKKESIETQQYINSFIKEAG